MRKSHKIDFVVYPSNKTVQNMRFRCYEQAMKTGPRTDLISHPGSGRHRSFVIRCPHHFPSVWKTLNRPSILSPEPAFDQRLGNVTALGDSKARTRNSWFRFYSARGLEIVVEMNKFQQPMRFGRLCGGLSV